MSFAVLLVVLAVLAVSGVARADVSPFWQELGGSASGNGISQTPAPKAAFDTSVAVGSDGLPVVVYAEYADVDATQGPIIVRGWNGSAWVTLSPPGGIAVGYLPQVRISPGGAIYVAWLQDDLAGNSEIHLRVRPSGGVSFDELGGSDAAGGISTANPGITFPFSLAVDADDRPAVAFLAAALTGIVEVDDTPDILQDTLQAYVRRWNGTAWEFVGSNFTGGGASNAVSFATATPPQSIVHSVETPALTLDALGQPVVAFTYVTEIDGEPIDNTDIYVTRWNGLAWEAVGPAVPAADSAEGRGGPGGVSNSAGGSLNPSIASGPDGMYALAWEEAPAADGALYVWVRVWNGTTAWDELAGSATGSGFTEPDTINGVPQIAVGPDGLPIVAWNALTPSSPAAQIFVLRWSGIAWLEPGLHAASDMGISDATLEAFAPALALTLPGGAATAGVPSVAWLDARGGDSAQVFLRQLFAGTAVSLDVTLVGNGTVASSPIGLVCTADACAGPFPSGTTVTLTATAETGGAFIGWNGACAFRGANPTCAITLGADTPVTASFRRFRVSVIVKPPAGTFGQGTIGTVSGNGLDCAPGAVGTCFADLSQGTPVTLQATPEPGNRFLNWSGGPCSGRTNATCAFVASGNTISTALFRGISTVSALKAGTGSGTVSGGGLACGTTCTASIFTGTSVTLTPTPATGSSFTGWSGDVCDGQASGRCVFTASGTNRSLTVTSQMVTATFLARKQKLTASTVGNGFVVASGGIDCQSGGSHTVCTAEYDFGTLVAITPMPDPDNRLVSWTGCTSLTGSTCNALMKANLSVRATFGAARTLSMSASGNGVGRILANTTPRLVCANECAVSQLVPLNATVTLTPQPAVGTTFRWLPDGDPTCTGSSTCSRVMSANRSAVGDFTLNRHTLAITRRLNGSVVSNPLPGGVTLDCGTSTQECGETFDFNTPVLLRATPDDGFVFVNWTGVTCAVGGATNASCAFALKGNTTATPNYRARTLVSVEKSGTGTGTVVGPGISCGTNCSEALFDAKLVTLTATPATGSNFLGFTGACVSSASPCTFVPAGNTQIVDAAFAIQLKTLRVTVVGDGSVAGPSGFLCEASTTPCTQEFPYGTVATLVPTAAPGFKFTGWSENCTGTSPTTCKPLMTANRVVTATFKQVFGVTVGRQGNSAASGKITATGITCGVDCAEDYLSGALVAFSRSAPPTGRTFRWLGDCAFRGTNASCTLTIDANKSVIGDYSLRPLGLTVNVTGPGRVTGAGGAVDCTTLDCRSVIDYGTAVLLQATPSTSPDPQGEFVGWTGCTLVAGTNCSFTLTANRTIAARFQPTVISLAVDAAIADAAVPLLKGARRQYSAVATFSDGTTRDVTTQAAWTSANKSVVTVTAASGLVTGVAFGSTNVMATFSTLTSTASDSIGVAADTAPANGVTVACEPYGEPLGALSCLPSRVGFEVECRATATFAHGGTGDVTDQAVWSSTSATIARSRGLSQFTGPVVASFRIDGNGAAAIFATVGAVVSSKNTSVSNAWVVQGTPLAVTGISVAPASLTIDAPAQLTATATLGPAATGTPAACSTPPPRDFSLLTTWETSDATVAEVNLFGLVEPIAAGTTQVDWSYVPPTGQTLAPQSGVVPVTVLP